MNASIPGYTGCRCGSHWWHWKTMRWVTMTRTGDVPIPLPTPTCCHVQPPEEKRRGHVEESAS